ncbi:hypothetical protein A2U01_0116853, partial [Trifolium medium]|nr:hypothetical protein [Trifolium medium]
VLVLSSSCAVLVFDGDGGTVGWNFVSVLICLFVFCSALVSDGDGGTVWAVLFGGGGLLALW